MVKNINFLVCGVARSGTTGLANVLNLHPNVYCSIEQFNTADNVLKKVFPQDFTGKELNEDLLKKKNIDELIYVGDKFPRYYYKFNDYKDIPLFVIQRSYKGYAPSWNGRAFNSTWHKGRVGIFAIFEFAISTICISRWKCSNVCFVDFDALYYGNSDFELQKAFDFLNLDFSLFDKDEFIANFYNRSDLLQRQRNLSSFEKDFYQYMKLDTIESEFSKKHPTAVMMSIYNVYAKWVEDNMLEILHKLKTNIEYYENRYTDSYFQIMINHLKEYNLL